MTADKKAAMAEVVAEYMEHTTLHGYRYLTESGRHWFERLVWVVVHTIATVGVIWQVQKMYYEYQNQEPLTTVQSMHYHVSLVPFPAVAVCDINKLRKSRVRALAAKLIKEYSIAEVTLEELTQMLRYLGHLYDNSLEGFPQILKLMALLEHYNVTLDYRGTMQQLGTQCDELLLSCRWAGLKRPCTDLFETRKTMEGYCCTFNYVRVSDNFDTRIHANGSVVRKKDERPDADGPVAEQPQASLTSGWQVGLSLLVHTELSEYFYPLLPTAGIKLLVFNPNDYPDTASGGLIEKLVMREQEVFFTLSAVTTKATSDVASLSRKRRKCLFSTEKTALTSHYSYSDCLMECRVSSIRNLCGCLPFFSPAKGNEEDTRVCEMSDLRCLNKHTEMWQTLRPSDSLAGLELEMTQSLECADCFPACGDTVYHVETTSMPLQQVLMDHSPFLKGFSIDNNSVFHIYFGTTSQTLMKKSVLMAWHDLLSNIGGICGVFVGFSAMSIIEFLYFFTLRASVALWCQSPRHQDTHRTPRVALPPLGTSVGVLGAAGGQWGAGNLSRGAGRHPELLLTPTTAPVDGQHFTWGRHSLPPHRSIRNIYQ